MSLLINRESPAAYRQLATSALCDRMDIPMGEARLVLEDEMAPLLHAGWDPIDAAAEAVAIILDGVGT